MSVVATARRHAALRWSGVPLLLTGFALLAFGIYSTVRGGPWTNIPLGLLSSGLGLSAFGANHDTALAYAQEAYEGPERSQLDDKLRGELEAELERDRDAMHDLRPSPKVALAMPFVAVLVQAFVSWRLLG
ncbi:MAG: hypothetical protein H6742_10740 [Alphaproteobacteria bacterium]|nr:hypothetical protein [Alphaproteobacteria bacterium]